MATIQDVAKHAHVGVATVSRVLNGSGYVKAETKERIMQAIKELNYSPNEMARNLYFKRTGIVAIIIPQIAHPFFAEFVDAVITDLEKVNYKAMICNTWDESHYELQYLDMLKRNMVDGIIFGAHSLDVEKYQNIDRPIVALDRELGGGIPCVCADHITGGRIAAETLLKAGCKNVLQFCGTKEVSTPSFLRHEMFSKVMMENGCQCRNYTMSRNGFSYEYFRQITADALSKYPDIDGVFATDVIVMSYIRQALSKGIRIPEDIKAVSYDGTSASDLSGVPLTTIMQPISQLASECVRMMMDLIQSKPIENTMVTLPVSLRKGTSA